MDIKDKKKAIRKYVAGLKKEVTSQTKEILSDEILENLVSLEVFQKSSVILMYHSLPDEVQTVKFIEKWSGSKRIILPVVDGDNLLLKEYFKEDMGVGYQSILEPSHNNLFDADDIELAIIPGVAFDLSFNRLGRGKGFYDRLIPALKCQKIGLAFPFQMVDEIPMESFDKPLDLVITCE